MADVPVIVADNVYKKMEDMGDGTHAERVVIVNQDGSPISSRVAIDAGGRSRISQITTLFDGKTLYVDEPDLWHGAGTGTATFDTAHNAMALSVTAGQWYVRQQNYSNQYFSGKSQVVESTTLDFAPQAGVIKRVGYFSSSSVSPHAADLDGYWLESNGDISLLPATGIRLVISNFGSQTVIPLKDWTNYADLQSYDWDTFTIALSDFLWLGGNDLRMFISLPNGGFSCHIYENAGNVSDVIFRSPNQFLRYEIRSTTGAGSFRFVCGQVSTEGSNFESGRSRASVNPSSIACNTVGTIYALQGIRKLSTTPNIAVKLTSFGVVNTASADAGVLMLIKSPTLSATLSYSTVGKVQIAIATNQTLTGGDVIAAVPIGQDGQHEEVNENYMLWMQSLINGTMTEYVLAYQPVTLNQNVVGVLSYKVF